MLVHSEECFVSFTPEQMFDLVADVEKYPEFLPWCVGARIKERQEGGRVLIAELIIRFKFFQERYTSKVTLDKENLEIDVDLVEGPFHHLDNIWKFVQKDEGCIIKFDIDFKMRSAMLQKMIGFMFEKSFHDMVEAFKDRASKVYG